jgi:gliding motility-associated-like protein
MLRPKTALRLSSMRKLIIMAIISTLFLNRTVAQCNACESLQNKIVNGDFENGNTAFNSSFDYVTFFPFLCTLCPENTYAIGNNATLFHNGFSGTDHTNPPTGDFFIANAPGQEGVEVWCQSTSVFPQTTYTFTFWARDIANNNNPHPLAVLRPSFNGEIVSESLLAEGDWSSLSVTWFSNESTTLDICILDFQSQTGGNDFGLDDITLTACEPIQLSQPVFAGNDTTVCSRDEIQLGIVSLPGYTYDWNSSENLSSNQLGNPSFINDNTTGITQQFTYWVTRDSASVGCITTDTVHIEVLSMDAFDLGNDLSVCPGDSISLIAGENWDNIVWSTSETAAEIIVPAGVYQATVFTGICSETDSVSVYAINAPDPNLPSVVNHCNTETLELDASINGTWIFEDLTYDDPIEVNNPGTYYFSYEFDVCSTTDSVEIQLYEMYEAQLPQDTTLCAGTMATLVCQQEGLWSDGSFGFALNVMLPGTYSIEVTNGPCTDRDTVEVFGLNLPALSLGPDTTFCEDFPLLLDAASEGATYLWSTGDTTASIITAGSNLYRVEVTNSCGTSVDEITITNFACSSQLYVPSCFTPNDDTYNEGWKVYGYNVREIDIVVYNRLGDAIFHTSDMNEAWTPGLQIGDDAYTYRIEATPLIGEKEVRTGVIYLIR